MQKKLLSYREVYDLTCAGKVSTIVWLKSLFKQNFDGSQKEEKSYWSMVWQKGKEKIKKNKEEEEGITEAYDLSSFWLP